MTARDRAEQSYHAAVARYHSNLDVMARKPAYDRLIDDLLKAWDRTQPEAAAAARRDQAHADHLDAALAAARRAVLADARTESYVAAIKRGKQERTG